METIPAMYWMVIIGVLVGFICFVLYQVAMLLKESKHAVMDSRKILQEAVKTVDMANVLLVDATEIVSTAKSTVNEVNNAIIGPIRRISSLLSVVSGFAEGLTSKRK